MNQLPRAAILTIGSELLRGDGVDTNSAWLSRRLEGIGYTCTLHLSCPDDEGAIVEGLAYAVPRADVVVTTGGLGPTVDDLTRAAVARFLGVPIETHPPSLEHIAALFARFGREMSASNRRQAELPQGARVLTNEVGTAPGFAASVAATGGGEVTIYSVPGVPREMRWMWSTYLLGELRARGGRALAERTFRTVGVAESVLGERLGPIEAAPDVEVRYAAEETRGTIRVTLLTTAGEERAQALWLEAKGLVGHHLRCLGTDELPEAVAAWLVARRLTLATAESCTGGRVAAALTAIPGISSVFGEGLVTYSNAAKTRLLGVPADLLAQHGAVSPEVAAAMARGARDRAGADLGLGVTGIAGPGGGSEEKPVGLVHLAVAGPGEAVVHRERRFPGTRELVQARATAAALGLIAEVCEQQAGWTVQG